MAIQTPTEFRTAHGDPAGWCGGTEVDEYLDDCLAILPTPAPVLTPATVHKLIGSTPGAGKPTPTATAA
ncbi:hypothetical protein [Streptomyces sp. NPDC056191]|uniref:hypothetical protein n=1 Tax=Streptomyces sp. NPDC056191 TaxID=3345742 RepID=UPI0035DD17F5